MRTHTGKAFKSFDDWNTDPDITNAARESYSGIDWLELYSGLHAEGHQGDSFGKQESNTVDSTSALRIMDSYYSVLLLWYAFYFYSMSICPTDS